MSPAQLLAAAQELLDHLPADAEISRNRVGNLAATRSPDCFVWVDVPTGEVHWVVQGAPVDASALPPL